MAEGCSLPVERFNSETEDFNQWVELLECAVGIAHNPTSDAAKHALCIQWLPIKLDSHGRTIFRDVDTTQPWEEIKKQLKQLLVNPEDKYNWHAGTKTITWDGQESFHSLASRVKTAVDKYDPKGLKEREYFQRFRLALPLEYRKAIDLNCGGEEEKCKIGNAKSIALRMRYAEADKTPTLTDKTPSTSTSSIPFILASREEEQSKDDRIRSLERQVRELRLQLRSRDQRQSSSSSDEEKDKQPSSHNQERDHDSHDHGGYRDYNRDRNRSHSHNHDPRHEARDRYDNSPDRYERDSRDRRNRDYYDRDDKRDDRGRHRRDDYYR